MVLKSDDKFDFIGDVHGNAKKLLQLIDKLGYVRNDSVWMHHENRQIIILGDFINVGKESKNVLSILYELWEKNIACVLVGNHEYFLALNFLKNGKSVFEKNSKIFFDYESLFNEFNSDYSELIKYIEWFTSLPLYLETEKFRAVHAYWNNDHISLIKNNNSLKEIILASKQKSIKKEEVKSTVNETLNGKLIYHYNSWLFKKPQKFRIKWWNELYNKDLSDNIIVHKKTNLKSKKITPKLLPGFKPYQNNEKPVFIGHYWFQTLPFLLKNNVCCLDFGAAKGGYLTAYRFNGEQKLDARNLVWV
jgi:hypothetical protein